MTFPNNLFSKHAAALCLLCAVTTIQASAQTAAKSDEYLDFNPGRTTIGSDWVQSIVIKSPGLRSEVQGDVKVEFQAPGMTAARALCWQQPTKDNPNPKGHDTVIGSELQLDPQGNGSFVFPADQYPNGPVTVRILANNADSSQKDIEELQLFNKGGVVWNQGIPKSDPPAAKGMKLAFSDDFDSDDLSISATGKGPDGKPTRYSAHTPWHGDFSGWQFANPDGPLNPFSREGTFLRIHASKQPDGKSSSGLISSVGDDGDGFTAHAPCYFECRFIAQSAPGTWPAFWTNTNRGTQTPKNAPGDELDIIEGYGGVGQGNPNHPGYSVTSHFWNQKGPDGKGLKPIGKRIDMLTIGDDSYWSTTFHTYAVQITKTDTIYYLDDIEVFRHPSGEISKTEPAGFLINYAIGGISGWKINLDREGNASDMWVDYVRVYQGE